MHDIISDIIDWDHAHKVYLAGQGQTGERYIQRLEAADRMAEIEARWHHLPRGFHGERKLIKTHIQTVAETTQVASKEELCWLAIAAATAWLPRAEPAELCRSVGEVPPADGQSAAHGHVAAQARTVVNETPTPAR